jgi:hypothetical protein
MNYKNIMTGVVSMSLLASSSIAMASADTFLDLSGTYENIRCKVISQNSSIIPTPLLLTDPENNSRNYYMYNSGSRITINQARGDLQAIIEKVKYNEQGERVGYEKDFELNFDLNDKQFRARNNRLIYKKAKLQADSDSIGGIIPPGLLVIRDSDKQVYWFDQQGNMVIEGTMKTIGGYAVLFVLPIPFYVTHKYICTLDKVRN